MNKPLSPLAKAAIRYASVYGLHVHPLKSNDKAPASTNGLKDATNDDPAITAVWTNTPSANIGLNCGASGLVALDFDVHKTGFDGGDLLTILLGKHPTVTSETQSGGYHLLYWQPNEVKLGNVRGNLPFGVDVRGLGGYIVLPPSKLDPDLIDANKIGKTDKDGRIITLEEVQAKRNLYRQRSGYQWVKGRGIGEIEIAHLPAFVLDMIQDKGDADPVGVAATAARKKNTSRADEDVIGQFNHDHPIIDLLIEKGYDLRSRSSDQARMVRPGGNSASVVIFLADNVSYHHSTSDSLHSEHCRDAFDIFQALYHRGNFDAAHEAAKREQGKWVESTDDKNTAIVEKTISIQPTAQADEDTDEDISPLDVTPATVLQLGWIDAYVDLMERLTASPREFHQLVALALVATVLDRKAWLPMPFGNIYPNIYACVVAPSTAFGKSTAISAPRRVLQSAMLDSHLIPAQGTSEGIIKALSLTPSALMIRDEIGTLFGSDRVKHLKDLKLDLTALYDCFPYSKQLSNEKIAVDKPYLNILGATTPTRFYANISNDDWLDGFMPRWLFVQPGGEPNFDRVTDMFDHDAEITRLAWRLMEIDKQKDTPFVLAGDAFTRWSSWRTDALKKAWKQRDEVAMAIIGRYATYALKFAIILAAVNGSWGTIAEDTMQTAIDLADQYKAQVYRIIGDRQKHEVTGGKLQRVFLLLQKRGGANGLTMREVTQFLNAGKAEIEPLLTKLVEVGAVMPIESRNAKHRVVTRYYTVTDKLPVKSYK